MNLHRIFRTVTIATKWTYKVDSISPWCDINRETMLAVYACLYFTKLNNFVVFYIV